MSAASADADLPLHGGCAGRSVIASPCSRILRGHSPIGGDRRSTTCGDLLYREAARRPRTGWMLVDVLLRPVGLRHRGELWRSGWRKAIRAGASCCSGWGGSIRCTSRRSRLFVAIEVAGRSARCCARRSRCPSWRCAAVPARWIPDRQPAISTRTVSWAVAVELVLYAIRCRACSGAGARRWRWPSLLAGASAWALCDRARRGRLRPRCCSADCSASRSAWRGYWRPPAAARRSSPARRC